MSRRKNIVRTPTPADARPLRVMEMPEEDRPREKLDRLGSEALTNAELTAILLRTGAGGENVVRVAQRLLNLFDNNLKRLADASVEEMAAVRGVGRVKAIQVKAALEIGKRLSMLTDDARPVIRTARDVERLLGATFRDLPQEEFRILLLNTRNEVTYQHVVSRGTVNASLVHPREVFREAIRRSCNAIICAHNHPSGDPSPSAEDVAITKRLVEAGDVIDIRVLDHVIIGDGRFLSMRERGLM